MYTMSRSRFTTTWDYTTLKRSHNVCRLCGGFTTTWDYTTLKRQPTRALTAYSFTTTWDYTTLKPPTHSILRKKGFTTTWDYTTLKLLRAPLHDLHQFYYHLGLHYSQTLRSWSTRSSPVLLPLGITLLSNFEIMEYKIISGFTTTWDYTTLKL